MKRPATAKATFWLIPLLLCMSLTTAHQSHAQKGDSTGGQTTGACRAQLSCELGRTRTYDYDAVFVSEADVETHEDSGYSSATLTGNALVSVTAVQSEGNLCTYAVELAEVDMAEIVRDEVVGTPEREELESIVQEPYYFTQSTDGQIIDVTLGREEVPEVATFKRGLVNALNVTLRPGERYEVVESDISGTYNASYEVSYDGDRTSLERQATKSGESFLKGGLPPMTFESTQATNFTLDETSCVIAQVNIDEVVIIDQPGAGDPAVSNHFHHETVKVRAAANMTLMSSSFAKGFRSLGDGRYSDDMITLPVATKVGLSSESLDNEAVISKLLAQLVEDADNKVLYRDLARAVRADSAGVGYLRDFSATHRPTGRLARGIGALLIGLGSEEAQAVLTQYYLADNLDDETRERIIGLSTLIEEPGSDLVTRVAAISKDATRDSWTSAALALGAYADKLGDRRPDLAGEIVDGLSTRLSTAGHGENAILYLRALGNAGAESTLQQLSGYLASDDALTRQSAVVGMRKIESPQVEQILSFHALGESSRSVKQTIQRVAVERVEKGLSGPIGMTKDVIIDWSWTDTFGGNIANATFAASALVEDEPYLIDLQASADGEVFNTDFDILDVQLLTERVSAQDRRFRFFVSLAGNNTGIIDIDDTETCSVTSEDTLWDESIGLLDLTSPPIPIIGPLTLSFTLDMDLEFSINFFRSGDWCTSNSDLQIGLTPGVTLEVDGYATLSLGFVRGGVGVAGSLIGIEFPVYADAEMDFQDAPTVCFKIDAQLIVADMELYAWGQVNTFFWGWRPNPRPRWTLWEFNLNPEAWNLYTLCDSNPDLHCLPDVAWWDGTSIDAWWDNANCFVTTPPPGTPFIANNAYYIEEDSTCPAGMGWDGTGCLVSNVNVWPGIGVSLFQMGNDAMLTLYKFGTFGPVPACPSGWTTTQYVPNVSRTCTRQPPPGYSASDFFLVNNSSYSYTVYINGSASCSAGNFDSTGCWLGNAPGGMTAFLWSGNFYYAEP